MSLSVHTIDTGTFKLDGGAMFGVVPKRLWNRLNPADENNMCTWAMRCLLVQSKDRIILVDTGIGTKQNEKFHSHFEPKNIARFDQSLNQLGISRSDITDVYLTHLHFDHAGGAVVQMDQAYLPAFPNAKYWTSQTHLDWAMNPNPRERASFLKENIQPLIDHQVLHFISEKDGQAFVPGMTYHFVDGHTRAMTYLKINTDTRTVVYCADLVPSSYHIGLPYIMSYDVEPLKSMVEKAALLEEAVTQDYILVFEHDPKYEAGTVIKNEKGRFVIDQIGTLQDFL